MKPTLVLEDFVRSANSLGVDVATVRAVREVEAKEGGFDSNGKCRILFEAHQFGKYSGHRFNDSHPTISCRSWSDAKKYYAKGADADIRNAKEWLRLEEAMGLDLQAAIKSASWGLFQIMGFNHSAAGFNTPEEFRDAMESSEGAQLDAFVDFLKKDRGGAQQRALQRKSWSEFANMYNGPGYADNNYHTKLKAAWEKYS